MRVVTLLLVLAPLLSTVATSHAADTQEECVVNFSESGSFFSGKQYKTSASLPGVKTGIAFKRAYASIAKSGYQITQADKEIGVISAAQQVSYSQGGKTAPLNVVIQPELGSNSKVAFSFSTAGGLKASSDTVRDEFCRITNDILAR